ncbi:MAG: SDR family NAD(P)-dependent oxidoreductase [Oscillospiraceae bacterium]
MRKTAVVTGASGCIGEACARILASRGWCVAAAANSSPEKADALCREIRSCGFECSVFTADLRKSSEAEKLMGNVKKAYGGIDAVVMCAGTDLRKLIADTSDRDWEEVISSNLSTVFYTMRAAVPHMLERGGAIVAFSSIWGTAGGSAEAAYSAAKAGVEGLVRAAAKELGPSGITVNCVAPGAIESPMNSFMTEEEKQSFCEDVPLGRFGTPEEAALAAADLLENRYVTGQVIGVNGGYVI